MMYSKCIEDKVHPKGVNDIVTKNQLTSREKRKRKIASRRVIRDIKYAKVCRHRSIERTWATASVSFHKKLS